MIVRNVKYYRGLQFDQYLEMPGVSFSSLKQIPVPQSAGVSLGTRVHQYVLEAEQYDWSDAKIVRRISEALHKYMGAAMHVLESEVAFTADFVHNGLTMQYKGRADKLKAGRMVVDFKILSGSLSSACERFGYDDQLSGYCLATGSPYGLIVAYNKARCTVETKIIQPNESFWEYQTARYGLPS